MSKIRVIATLGRRATIVGYLYALLLQPIYDRLFKCKARVIAGDAEFEICHVYRVV